MVHMYGLEVYNGTIAAVWCVGAPRVVRAVVRLPLTLVIRQCTPVKQANHKLTIDTNKPAVALNDLFAGRLFLLCWLL